MSDLSDYRGRWAAISSSGVVASGDAAVEVYRVALLHDPSESFSLGFIEPTQAEPLRFGPIQEKVRPFLVQEKTPVYLVGGAVRDALLERSSHDIDYVVPRGAVALAFRVANAIGAPAYILDDERDTGRVVLPEIEATLDFAGYRGRDLLADLQDRDFTINALAVPAASPTPNSIIDPCGGLTDLGAKKVRLTHPLALQRDPIRALRAVRLAVELGFDLTPETRDAVQQAAETLQEGPSAERIRDELVRIVGTPGVGRSIELMDALGLLAAVLPEVASLAGVPQSAPHHEEVLAHTVSVLRWLEMLLRCLGSEQPCAHAVLAEVNDILAPHLQSIKEHLARPVDGGLDGGDVLRFAALFHDAGKQSTRTTDSDGRFRFFGHDEVGAEQTALRLRKLSFSNDAVYQITRIVAEHMRPLMLAQAQGDNPARRAAYRFFKATGDNGLDVALLSLADHLATYDGPGEENQWRTLVGLVSSLFDFYFERYEETVQPVMLVNGRDLMAHLGLPPGPEIGRILRLIEENQAAGEITSREEALHFAEQVHAAR